MNFNYIEQKVSFQAFGCFDFPSVARLSVERRNVPEIRLAREPVGKLELQKLRDRARLRLYLQIVEKELPLSCHFARPNSSVSFRPT